MDLWLIRHTAVAAPPGTCYGQTDVGLAETFLSEAAAVQAKLNPHLDWASVQVVSSPAQRCRRLAESFPAKLAPRFDPELWELHFGAWEGLPWDLVPRAELDLWSNNYTALAPPGGETFAAVQERTMRAYHRIGADAAQQVVCVAHAGVIRALLADRLGFPLANAFTLQIDYGGITRLRLSDGRCQILGVNL